MVLPKLQKDTSASPAMQKGSYRPLECIVHYFNEFGCAVRVVRPVAGLDDCKKGDAQQTTDTVADCTKTYVLPGEDAYVMYFFCPLHGRVWGKQSMPCLSN